MRTYLSIVLIHLLGGMFLASCKHTSKEVQASNDSINVVFKDYGNAPAVLNIDEYSVSNTNFRTTLWTGEKLQVTLMSIPAGGEIGLELHPHTEQFLRIEEGVGKVMMGDTQDSLSFTQTVEKDFAVFVPAGKWHNIVNTGDKPLKLYSIYSPVEHAHGTVHKTYEESEAAEH